MDKNTDATLVQLPSLLSISACDDDEKAIMIEDMIKMNS